MPSFSHFTIRVFFFVILLTGIFYFLGTRLFIPSKVLLQVAITQIAPHPSLDKIRSGIIDALSMEKLAAAHVPPVEIIFQNAQGNMATATQIAKKFAGIHPKVIVPITTPSAQTVYNVAKDRSIPIVFAAVSDPKTARLMPSGVHDLITGVSDLAPISEQAALIADIFKGKESIVLGIIFNPGEANSVHLVELMTQALEKYPIKVLKATAGNTTEVTAAVQSLMGKVSAIYLPNDNTVISALEAVLRTTHEHKIPVFSSDPESVERGCLAAIAPDQYEIGQQVGSLVIKILQGYDIRKLPIEPAKKNIFILNLDVARKLSVTIPKEMEQKATRLIVSTAE